MSRKSRSRRKTNKRETTKRAITRRDFLKYSAGGVAASQLSWLAGSNAFAAGGSWRIEPSSGPVPGGTLDPLTIPKFIDPLPMPGVMPTTGSSETLDSYEIAVTQFEQQVLSTGMPMTTVWGYGPASGTGSYPAATIEASHARPVQVKWVNGLVDGSGNYLPHLLPVDQTMMWANPPGGAAGRDAAGTDPAPYTGPVPIVTHLHGAHVTEESDGYPTAWYLPNATNVPGGYASRGTNWGQVAGAADEPGSATFQYPNDQRATTLWFHDHALGMTRTNVYAGPVGFYLVRGGPDDLPPGVLPSGPYEVPIVLQDKSFNADGSLFYPDNRAFFEGLEKPQLQIPFAPASDMAPLWNPEFFGNAVVVNGKTWPYMEVEQRRYRFRFLNGSDSRFFILEMPVGVKFWVIGADGGFLPEPMPQTRLLIAPAERLDVIMDFTDMEVGKRIVLRNVGPDEPFGGGIAGKDFAASNPDTTGVVMQFRVVKRVGKDTSTAPNKLRLPAITPISGTPTTRYLSLNELSSASVFIEVDSNGDPVLDANGNLVAVDPNTVSFSAAFAPQSARLGTLNLDDTGNPLMFGDPVSETPALGATEIWEIRNFTADAHPIHIHQIQFEVIERVDQFGNVTGPEPWETGFKDTAIMYPGDEGEHPGITRVKVRFDIPGLFLWHCHILSHEDNEMMRPIQVVA